MHLVIQFLCVSAYICQQLMSHTAGVFYNTTDSSSPAMWSCKYFFPIATTYQKAFQAMGIHRKDCCHLFQQSSNCCMNTSELVNIPHQNSEVIQLWLHKEGKERSKEIYRYCQILKLLIKNSFHSELEYLQINSIPGML